MSFSRCARLLFSNIALFTQWLRDLVLALIKFSLMVNEQQGDTVQALEELVETHVVRKISIFDTSGKLIEPGSYEAHLRGATVIMRLTMERFVLHLGQGSEKGMKDFYVANISSVRVVVPPKRVAEAPRTKKLYSTDPFTPSLTGKGKKRNLILFIDNSLNICRFFP